MRRKGAIIRDVMLTVLILCFLALVIVKLDEAHDVALSGTVRVIDGDTVMLGGDRIRLAGIDAPELRQSCQRSSQPWPCGVEARVHLASLIGGGPTDCRVGGSDRYGRLLAVCFAQGRDLNAAMVADGYAIAFGNYEEREEAARQARLGLWAGTFDSPRSWRQTHGGMEEAPHALEGWLTVRMQRLGAALRSLWPGDVDG